MKSSTELRELRAGLVRQGEAILENSNGHPDEKRQGEFDNLITRIKALDGDIERAVELEAHQAEGERVLPRRTPFEQPNVGPLDASVVAPHRRGSLQAFSNDTQGREAAYRAGRWLQATILQDEHAERWCNDAGMKVDIRAAMSTSPASAGGALVPTELADVIINLREMYGVFRQQSRVVEMGSNALSIPRKTGGLTSYFVAENVAGTESDTTWDNVDLLAEKLMVLTRMSSEIDEDSVISLADFLAREMAEAFASKEDACGFTGDGTSGFGGMTGIVYRFENETLAGNVAAPAGTNTIAEITLADLMSCVATLPQYASRSAAWFCSQFTYATLFQNLLAAGGGNTIDTLTGAAGPAFLGYPVVVSQTLAGVGDLAGKAMLMFGDLSLASTMGSRRDFRFRMSEDVYFAEDQVGVKATERFDIQVHDVGSSSVAGPVVALIGTA